MNDYCVRKISSNQAKEYIIKNHYSHGCSNAPFPCYGLFEEGGSENLFYMENEDKNKLIGVLMFATPCSENVRASVFGEEYKDWVVELHRLHILDVTPKNTESWFISRCLKLLKKDRPQTRAVISFSDTTVGHSGIIYKASNFYNIGSTGCATFFLDKNGRLRHPHQNGKNITKQASSFGWIPVKRQSKNRYLYLLPDMDYKRKKLISMCKYKLNRGEYEKRKSVEDTWGKET